MGCFANFTDEKTDNFFDKYLEQKLSIFFQKTTIWPGNLGAFLMLGLMIRLMAALERPGFPLEHFIKLFL